MSPSRKKPGTATWTPPADAAGGALRDRMSRTEWFHAVEEIAARHGLDTADASPFESGSDVVWSLGDHVLKLTEPRWDWQIEAEARHLELVRGRLSVETPHLVATGVLSGWPYVVMTRVRGQALAAVWPRLDHTERLRLAAALGRTTAELHALEVAPSPAAWSSFWAECRHRAQSRTEDVPAAVAAEVGPFLESVGELPGEPRAFLHTELLDHHVLVKERGGHVEPCGLIDFADGRVGPIEYEFPAPVEFLFRGETGLLRAYLRAYGYAPEELTDETSERLLAWGLSHRYGSLARMLSRVEPARPATLPELARALYGLSS